ncbi:MAG: MOSC domain-containing protein [bacterium]|nr:MOSC domain-containing protein [bacterium]
MEGRVVEVCRSKCKGVPKEAISEGRLVAEHGLEGDAHAGQGHRQLSLLLLADIDEMRAHGLELEPGAFGENLVVDGLDLDCIGVGSRLQVGEALLEVSQIGKECHSRCAIFYTAGDCIMPRSGVFVKVVCGGVIRAGTAVTIDRLIARNGGTEVAARLTTIQTGAEVPDTNPDI